MARFIRAGRDLGVRRRAATNGTPRPVSATRVGLDRDRGKKSVHVDVKHDALPAVRRRSRRSHPRIRVEDLLPDLVLLAAEERQPRRAAVRSQEIGVGGRRAPGPWRPACRPVICERFPVVVGLKRTGVSVLFARRLPRRDNCERAVRDGGRSFFIVSRAGGRAFA